MYLLKPSSGWKLGVAIEAFQDWLDLNSRRHCLGPANDVAASPGTRTVTVATWSDSDLGYEGLATEAHRKAVPLPPSLGAWTEIVSF